LRRLARAWCLTFSRGMKISAREDIIQ
jgi:hypothetical protein